MTTEFQPIEQLTVDGEQYAVDDLPEGIQAGVRKYDDWRERQAVAQDELNLVSAALNSLSAQIVNAVREWQTEDEKAEETAEAESTEESAE